jgi:ABC-2 type transport system ATP-binding protein
MSAEAAITVRDLRKSYDGHEAVRGITFDVAAGEVFALLGPNGAGKTTTVEILEGFRNADAGAVQVLGFDPARSDRRFREQIGIVLQGSGVYPYTTPREILSLFATYYPNPHTVDYVLNAVDLQEQSSRFVRTLSGGQVRRLDVALALIGRPKLIFLDEPTTGFDPNARREAWAMIASLAAGGTTVLLTTHYMEEAQTLAHRVAVIRAGEIVALGEPAALAAGLKAEIRFAASDALDVTTITSAARAAARRDGDRIVIAVDDPTRPLHELTGWAISQGIALDQLEVVRPRLEDVYLALTQQEPHA